jgi:hypothetical protein
MQHITERQRALLSDRVVLIDHKNIDFYALGRNTRIVYGDNLKLAQDLIERETLRATIKDADDFNAIIDDVDDFFDGYWNGVEALLLTLPEEDVVIDVKIEYQGHEWHGKLDSKEAFMLNIREAIKKEQDPIWTLVEMARKGNEVNSDKNDKKEPCFSIVPAQWNGIS